MVWIYYSSGVMNNSKQFGTNKFVIQGEEINFTYSLEVRLSDFKIYSHSCVYFCPRLRTESLSGRSYPNLQHSVLDRHCYKQRPLKFNVGQGDLKYQPPVWACMDLLLLCSRHKYKQPAAALIGAM